MCFHKSVFLTLFVLLAGQVLDLNAQISAEVEAEDMFENALSEQRAGNLDSAIEKYFQAIYLYSDLPDSAQIATIYSRIANAYISIGDISESKSHNEKSISIGLEYDAYLALAIAKNNESYYHILENDYDGSRRSLQEALEFAILAEDTSTIISTYSNLSNTARATGNYAKSVEYLEVADSYFKDFHNANNLFHVQRNLSASYSTLGNKRKALSHRYLSLQAAKELDNITFIAEANNGIGLLHRQLGNYRLARHFYITALEIAEENDLHRLHATVLNNLGWLFSLQNHHDLAEEYYLKSLAIRQQHESRSSQGVIYNNLARVYREQGKLLKAEEFMAESVSIRRESRTIVTLANSLTSYANLLQELEKYEEAIVAIDEAIELRQQVGNRRMIGLGFNTKADIYLSKGDYNQADRFLRLTRHYFDGNDLPPPVLQSHIDFYRATDPPLAFEYTDLLLKQIENERQLMGYSTEQRSGYFQNQADKLNEIALWYFTDKGDINKTYHIIESTKARTLLDDLSGNAANMDQYWSNEDLQRRNDLQTEINFLQSDYANESDELKRREIRQAIQTKRFEYENFINRVFLNNSNLARFSYPQPHQIDDTRDLLDDKTLILNFAFTKQELILLGISKQNIAGWTISTTKSGQNSADYIKSLITQLRYSINGKMELGLIHEISEELYDLILSPAQQLLDQYNNVILIPDAELAYLPFEVLRNNGQYLVETHSLKYMPSATAMSYINRPLQRYKKDMLVVADPVYESEILADISNGAFTSLPSTRLEAQVINNVFPNAELITGERANSSLISSLDLTEYRYLHFATHGLVNQEVPEATGLVFSPLDLGDDLLQENGIFTLGSIYSLDITSEMVVLSACDSGMGYALRGEGVMGLQRAFLIAGASSVVSSLWPVYDQSTAMFMEVFYRKISQHKPERSNNAQSKPSAGFFGTNAHHLRSTKIEMINSRRYAHPVYWAPFILTGN